MAGLLLGMWPAGAVLVQLPGAELRQPAGIYRDALGTRACEGGGRDRAEEKLSCSTVASRLQLIRWGSLTL